MIEDVVADVSRRLGGRTLVLFTSHQQLRDIYTALKHRSDLDDVLILGQGIDGQRRHLLRAVLAFVRAGKIVAGCAADRPAWLAGD